MMGGSVMKAGKVGKNYVFGLTVGLSLVISPELMDRIAADQVSGAPLALKTLQDAVRNSSGATVQGKPDFMRLAQTFCNGGSRSDGKSC
jgi:hypothetical protein